MRHLPTRRGAGTLAAAALCTAAALLAGGCSSDDGDGKASASRGSAAPPVDYREPPKVSATPKVEGTPVLELPLEAYDWTDAEVRVRWQGEDKLAAACMAGFGFELEPRPPYKGDKHLRDANRYGVTDADTASRFGYKVDPAERGERPREDYTPAESLVLFGPGDGQEPSKAKDDKGKPVPKGGCWGKALRDMAAEGPEVPPDKEEFANHLATFAFQESQKDTRVRKVFSAWSACMKEKGYRYGSPMDPVEDTRFTKDDTASAEELRVAGADVACKRAHNVVGVWYGVEVAYQKKAIDSNRELLDTLKESKEAKLRAAAEAPRP